jgi:hypothetical protein
MIIARQLECKSGMSARTGGAVWGDPCPLSAESGGAARARLLRARYCEQRPRGRTVGIVVIQFVQQFVGERKPPRETGYCVSQIGLARLAIAVPLA